MPKNELMNDYMIREFQISTVHLLTNTYLSIYHLLRRIGRGGIVSYVALIVSTKP